MTASDTVGASFVLIASSVGSATVGASLAGIASPTWVAKPYLLDDFGMTGPVAGVVATAAGRAAAFSYQQGATLVSGGPAPGCRITFPLFQTAVAAYGADGWALVEAAARCAADGCPAPRLRSAERLSCRFTRV